MIITECPYCSEPQMIGWEAGMSTGWLHHRCHECSKVMWTKCAEFFGNTITTEDFKASVMLDGDEERVDEAVRTAPVRSCVVYEEEP